MTITPRNGDLTAGVAGSYTETIGASPDPFITGDVPALFTTDELVLEDEVLAARSVVGLDAAGKLVMAKTSATAVKPIGVLVYAVDATGVATMRARVYRGGVLQPRPSGLARGLLDGRTQASRVRGRVLADRRSSSANPQP